MKIITYETIEGVIEPEWHRLISSFLGQAGLMDLEISPASHELKDLLINWNGKDDLLWVFACHVGDTTHTRLFISSPNQKKYKNYCKYQVGHAEWGCCLGGTVALDYSPAKYRLTNQLHEALHLFGVDDCYDQSTQKPLDSCKEPDCLMRYGVQSTKICSSVLSQLRD